MIVGRVRDAQIFLDSRAISRRHAEFNRDPFERWWVRDLGSHNGTLVNGNRITEHLLKPGDIVQVGEFSLTFANVQESSPLLAHSAARISFGDAGSGKIAGLRDFAGDPPRLGATHLSILSDFGQELLGLTEPDQRLAALCGLMVRPEFHGRTAMALRASKDAASEAPRALCAPQSAAGERGREPYISRSLLRTMLRRNEPVLASNSALSHAGPANADLAELSLASEVMTVSAVACPILAAQDQTDLLYVLFPPEYGTPEWLALTSLAVKQFQQADTTWAARKLGEEHAAIERELSRAHAIQTRLLPWDISIPGLDFAIAFVPCMWVGGDYVDLIQGADGRILLTIADVCGKGLPAALVASSLHMLTHTAMRTRTPLPEIMQNLNVYLSETIAEGMFVTMIAAMLEPETGRLEIINAGHPAGFFVTPAGGVSRTQHSANMPLGLEAQVTWTSSNTTLAQDSYLVLFTDGLSELRIADGELLGERALGEQVAGLIKGHAHAPASGVVSEQLTALLDSIQEGMPHVVRTFLVARRR